MFFIVVVWVEIADWLEYVINQKLYVICECALQFWTFPTFMELPQNVQMT